MTRRNKLFIYSPYCPTIDPYRDPLPPSQVYGWTLLAPCVCNHLPIPSQRVCGSIWDNIDHKAVSSGSAPLAESNSVWSLRAARKFTKQTIKEFLMAKEF